MTDIKVNVKYDNNFYKLQEIIDNAAEELKKRILQKLDRGAYEITADAKALAPKKTGALINSITHIVTVNGVKIYVGVPYAGYQEFGTKFIDGKFYLTTAFSINLPMIEAEISATIINYFEGER